MRTRAHTAPAIAVAQYHTFTCSRVHANALTFAPTLLLHASSSTAMSPKVATWAPEGGAWQRFTQRLVGRGPRLVAEEVAFAPGDRFRLQTRAAGLVHVDIHVVTRDFHKHEVVLG